MIYNYDGDFMILFTSYTIPMHDIQTSMSVRMGRMVAMPMPIVWILRAASLVRVKKDSLEKDSTVQVSK